MPANRNGFFQVKPLTANIWLSVQMTFCLLFVWNYAKDGPHSEPSFPFILIWFGTMSCLTALNMKLEVRNDNEEQDELPQP